MSQGAAPSSSLIDRLLGRGRRLSHRLRGVTENAVVAAHVSRLIGQDVSSIKTFTSLPELAALYRLARACPRGAQALEIGSYLGASTCYIAAALEEIDGRLVCIDTWQNETMPDGTRDTFAEFHRHTAGVARRITTLRKNSADLTAADLPAGLFFAFIDGDHSYAAARRDAALVAPHLVEGGILAFHDAIHFAGVSRTIGEWLATGAWSLGGMVENLLWLKKTVPVA